MSPMTGVVIHEWSVDLSTASFTDKSLLVIGGTSGLGQAIAKEALQKGCKKVAVVGRTFKDDPASIEFLAADLSLMKEAKRVGETIEPADIVVLTAGVVAGSTRQVSEEGIEMDMAVSFLSRLTLLHYLVPRLPSKARVFIMGFPGSNQNNYDVDNLNAEEGYKGGFGFVHMNTVTGNEALVLDSAKHSSNGVTFFGLNPGLIKTGIRDNMYTGFMKIMRPLFEGLIGLMTVSPAKYAATITPLLFANGLEDHNGSMFNPKAQPVLKSAFMTDELIEKFMTNSKKLVEDKAGISFGETTK